MYRYLSTNILTYQQTFKNEPKMPNEKLKVITKTNGKESAKEDSCAEIAACGTPRFEVGCPDTPVSQTPGLAIPAPYERICADAQPVLDPESVKRFCQVWAEVGRAILARRSKQNE